MGINKDLGLPFGDGMETWCIAFDVDGTLIDHKGVPTDIVDMLYLFSRFKNVHIVVWSGGGKDYAERIVESLGIRDRIWRCASKTEWPEIKQRFSGRVIAIDDVQDTRIGLANLIVRNK